MDDDTVHPDLLHTYLKICLAYDPMVILTYEYELNSCTLINYAQNVN
jgi:hypothetical protein